jgi:hypothetical protein
MVSGRRRLVAVATAGALGASCLAIVGCGSGGSGSGAAADPLAGQTGTRVLAEAVADLNAAPSLTVNGAEIESGEYLTVHLGIVPGKGCTRTIMFGELGVQGTITYITIGKTVYFKPNSTMWQALEGSDAAKITQLVDGRYVKDPSSDVNLRGVSCDITGPAAKAGDATKGQVTMLNGIRVLPLKDSLGDVAYVTDTSKPEFVQKDTVPVAGTTDPAGESTFTIGAPVTLTPPPASQVVSGAIIGM